jgi:hypothetical protein
LSCVFRLAYASIKNRGAYVDRQKVTGELKMEQENHMQKSKGANIRIYCRSRLGRFPKPVRPILTLSKCIIDSTIAILSSRRSKNIMDHPVWILEGNMNFGRGLP